MLKKRICLSELCRDYGGEEFSSVLSAAGSEYFSLRERGAFGTQKSHVVTKWRLLFSNPSPAAISIAPDGVAAAAEYVSSLCFKTG